MKPEISCSLLIKTWLPIAMGFIFFRLMAQIDLIMLTPFGADYIAGFGVPTKIMLLDLLAAFSIGPVASIFLAQAKSNEDRARHAGQIITLSFLISVVITAVGLLVYPIILSAIIKDEGIFQTASMMLFWFTLAIPFRLTHFVQSMIHHGIGQGKVVLWVDAIGLLLNVPINFLFIKYMGAEGIFVGTFTVSCLTSTLFFLSLTSMLRLNIFHILSCNFALLKNFVRYSIDEFLRLSLQFGHGFMIVTVLGFTTATAPHILTAFSASSETGQIVMFAFIAIMRSVAVISARSNATIEELAIEWRKTAVLCFSISLMLSVAVAFFSRQLGEHIYGFENPALKWWTVYLVFISVALPMTCLNSFFRGMLQSKKQFSYMTRIETIAKRVIGLPIFFVGIKLQMPIVAWSCFVLSELVELALYSATFFLPHARITILLHAKPTLHLKAKSEQPN